MKQLTTTTQSEQDDLLISPYLNRDALPQVLRDVLAVASTDDQRDMLLLHAADAFTQIHGEATQAVPQSRSAVQRLTFLAQLPEKFTTGECTRMSAQLGVSSRTIEKWLSRWTEDGTLIKEQQGLYRKSA